jgi:hypothetical protein
MILSTCLLLAATTLTSPPMMLNWATAEVAIGSDDASATARCGVENARVLMVMVQQTTTYGMDKGEREAYGLVVDRLEAGYDSADQREKAILIRDHLVASKNWVRVVSQGWLELEGIPVTVVYVFDLPSGNIHFKITDELTGAYAAYTLEPDDAEDYDDTRRLVQEMVGADDEATKNKALDEIMDTTTGSLATFEVNGVRDTIHSTDPEFITAQFTNFAELWPHLSPDEGRERIELAIAILWQMINDEGVFRHVVKNQVLPEVHPDSMGHNECALKAGIRFVDPASSRGGVLNYSPVPDEIVEDFFGDDPLPMPDPNLGWKDLRKELH